MSAGSSTSNSASIRMSTPRAAARDHSAGSRCCRVTDGPAPDRKGPGRPPRVRGGREKRGGLQSQRAPDYVLVGHICADILPNGTVVLGGTALYSALTVAALGWRVGVLTRGRYGVTIDGVAVPDLGAFSDRVQVIVQDAE